MISNRFAPFIHGFVVRRHEPVPSNWRAEYTLDGLLKEYGIVGISDIDTRMLTRIIRHARHDERHADDRSERVEELQERLARRR